MLGGLAGYGDSDSDNDGTVAQYGDDNARDTQSTTGITSSPLVLDPGPEVAPTPTEDAILEARRARAREWAAKRRAVAASANAGHNAGKEDLNMHPFASSVL